MKKSKHLKFTMITRFSKGNLRFFAAMLFWSVCATVLSSLMPQVIRLTIDSVLGSEPFALPAFLLQPLEALGGRAFLQTHLYWILIVITLLALGGAFCTYRRTVDTTRGAEGFVKSMRDALFAHIQRLPLSWHAANQTGDIIQRCTSDVEVVKNFVSGQLTEVFRTAFLVAWSLFMMFSMNGMLSLVALAFIPIILLYSWIFYRKIGARFLVADEAEGKLSSIVQENLTGVRVVRAFGRERDEIDKFKKQNGIFADLWIKLGYLMGCYWGLGDLITGLQIMTVLIVGTAATVNNTLTLGELMAFISYNTTLVWPIRSLGRTLSEMSKAGVSVDRLAYILDAQEEKDESALSPDVHGQVRFDHVSFSYPGGNPILKDVSFEAPAGSTVAILGETGSGKSTMMHLLTRLYDLPPDHGHIYLDGTDIRRMDRRFLRQNIGIVLQEPFLYSRTIEENIAVACEKTDRKAVRQAAKIACVDEAIEAFADGYDTPVGERGVTLSGGQKQRVAIARMLMRQTPVMIFDDSLSAVDAETDVKIRSALRSMPRHATTFLISHRVATLMHADQILVLRAGKIVERGTHAELLRQNGIYKQVYDLQTSLGEDLHGKES